MGRQRTASRRVALEAPQPPAGSARLKQSREAAGVSMPDDLIEEEAFVDAMGETAAEIRRSRRWHGQSERQPRAEDDTIETVFEEHFSGRASCAEQWPSRADGPICRRRMQPLSRRRLAPMSPSRMRPLRIISIPFRPPASACSGLAARRRRPRSRPRKLRPRPRPRRRLRFRPLPRQRPD